MFIQWGTIWPLKVVSYLYNTTYGIVSYCILLALKNFRNVLNDVKIMRISGVYHFNKRTNY